MRKNISFFAWKLQVIFRYFTLPGRYPTSICNNYQIGTGGLPGRILALLSSQIFSFPVVIPDFRSLVPLFLKAFWQFNVSYVSLRLVLIVVPMVMGNDPSVALGGQKLS